MVSGSAQVARVFDGPNGMMLNYIKADSTDEYEAVMRRVADALAASDDPIHQDMAQGWHIFKAREPGQNNTVLYLWWIDPAPEGANYAVSKILKEFVSEDELQRLYQQFTDAYAGGQSMVNLDPIFGEPTIRKH